MTLERCPKHPDTQLIMEHHINLTGWCPKCQTWRNILDGGDVIEAYEHQIERRKEQIKDLEQTIKGLREGPVQNRPKKRKKPLPRIRIPVGGGQGIDVRKGRGK